MIEFITNLTWMIVGIILGFVVVYSLVRLSAIAWLRTKHEYDTLPYDEELPERKRQNNEEL